MDLKYTVLMMTDTSMFMNRVELAILAHGLKSKREVITFDDRITNTKDFINANFVEQASISKEDLFLIRVPMRSDTSDLMYFVSHNTKGDVTAFYRVSLEFYGPSETRTHVTAITITNRHQSYSEMKSMFNKTN